MSLLMMLNAKALVFLGLCLLSSAELEESSSRKSRELLTPFSLPTKIPTASPIISLSPATTPATLPTVAPVRTLTPIQLPSIAPFPISTPKLGWMYASFYVGGLIDDNIVAVNGVATGICYDDAFGSQMFTCSAADATYTFTRWDNFGCVGNIIYTGSEDFTSISLSTDELGLSTSVAYARVEFQCSASTTVPTPKSIPFVAELGYQLMAMCTEGQSPMSFSSVVANKCLTVNATSSVIFNFPTLNHYQDSGCAGGPFNSKVVVPGMCTAETLINTGKVLNFRRTEAAAETSASSVKKQGTAIVPEEHLADVVTFLKHGHTHLAHGGLGASAGLISSMNALFDDDYAQPAYQWSTITNGDPTFRPTQFPLLAGTRNPTILPGYPTPAPSRSPSTLAPTASEVYQFNALQRLYNVSSTDFSSTTINKQVMQEAVAQCMTDLTASNIIIVNVTVDSTTAHSLVHAMTSTPVSSCLIGYTVRYDLAALGFYNNPSGAYTSLTTQLRRNVHNGNFDSHIQSAASNEGAAKLIHVTSNSVNFTSYSQVNTNPTLSPTHSPTLHPISESQLDKNNHKVSRTAVILGAVLGGLCLICVFCFMLLRLVEEQRGSPQQGEYVDVQGITAANRAKLQLELAEGGKAHSMHVSTAQQERVVNQKPAESSYDPSLYGQPASGHLDGQTQQYQQQPPPRLNIHTSVMEQQEHMLHQTPDLGGYGQSGSGSHGYQPNGGSRHTSVQQQQELALHQTPDLGGYSRNRY